MKQVSGRSDRGWEVKGRLVRSGDPWCRFVMRIEMPPRVRVKLVEALADVE